MNLKGLSELSVRTTAPPISWLMRAALERPNLISLAAGFTDNPTLPRLEVRQLLSSLLDRPKTAWAALQYGTTIGDPILRRLTAQRLLDQDGHGEKKAAELARNLIITHGSQQLLYLATECLCDPGDIVLVEDPTYFVYLGILRSRGVRCRGIRLQDPGIDPAHLEEVLERLRKEGQIHRVKLLYCVSYFHNPTGRTTDLETKRSVLAVLRRFERLAGHRLYLLEDAAYRELRFSGKDVPSALSLPGAAGRVIYAGTYSKPFATGIRVGFAWLPEPLFSVVSRIKGNHDFGTASLLQQLLVQAIQSGAYDQHLEIIRRRYATKAEILMAGIRRHFPAAVRCQTPRGGLYVWAQLPASVRTGLRSTLFQSALRQGILYVPGGLCYGPDPTRRALGSEMRLSFGGASPREIRKGIARLGTILHARLPETK